MITDLVMPEREGLETLQSLRAERPELPVIVISGAFGGSFLKTARRFGAAATLPKPIDPEALLRAVRDALARGLGKQVSREDAWAAKEKPRHSALGWKRGEPRYDRDMNQLREHWEGVSLPGDYLLERWMTGDDNAGYFEASCGPDGRRAEVKLVPESAAGAGAQFALWQRARSLQHPNLRALLDCGRAELAGEAVLYAVFEYADDSLASALVHSPLSEAEAREVLEAAVSALDYLKSQRLTHCALDPEHVVAVGDQIKLSTDALGEAAAGTRRTARNCGHSGSRSPPARWRGAPTSWRRFWAAFPAPAGRQIRRFQPKSRQRREAVMRPAVPEDTPPAQNAFAVTPAAAQRFPKWIPVGAAGVVLLILGLHFRSAPDTPGQPAPAPIVSAPVPKASPAGEGEPTPVSKVVSPPASKLVPRRPMWRPNPPPPATERGA